MTNIFPFNWSNNFFYFPCTSHSNKFKSFIQSLMETLTATIEHEILNHLRSPNHPVIVWHELYEILPCLSEAGITKQAFSTDPAIKDAVLLALKNLKRKDYCGHNCGGCSEGCMYSSWYYKTPVYPSRLCILGAMKDIKTKEDAKSLKQIFEMMDIDREHYVSLCSSLFQMSHEGYLKQRISPDNTTVYYLNEERTL